MPPPPRQPSPAHLLGVELVELRLLAVAPPQTQHLGLGAVGHVDELLVPPAFVHGADVAAQDDAVVAHLQRREEGVSAARGGGGDEARRETCTRLHEEDVSGGVGAGMDDERLLLDVAASAGPDGQLAAVLTTNSGLRDSRRRTTASSDKRGDRRSPCWPVCPESR